MGEELREWARYRLSERNILDTGIERPSGSGVDIANNYKKAVTSATHDSTNAILKQSDIRMLLEDSIDSKNGKSQLGWVSAGLMPFTFARVQSRIDSIVYTDGASVKSATNPFLVGGMGLLWTVGITLEYVLPFTILVVWMWVLIKWAATVIYVLMGAPLWAISHIAPEGHGFSSNSAQEGYYTLVDLALRPCLLVVGIIASMGIWFVL